jgi:hypothetical protein
VDADKDTCQLCGADLRDKPIPPEEIATQEEWDDPERRFDKPYGPGQTHFMHTVGVEIQGRYDGVMYWMCPFCRGAWNRWPKGHHRHAEAQGYVDEVNRRAAESKTAKHD